MKFLIEPYIRKRTEDLLFLQLNKEAISVKNYEMPTEGLFVPLLTTELAENIKTKDENKVITANAIVRGIIYLLGIDPQFKHKDEYVKFLYAVNPEIEDYINFEAIKFADRGKMIESIIFLKALVLLNNKNVYYLFNYSLNLIQYAEDSLKAKPKVQVVFRKEAKVFLEMILDIDESFSLAYYHLGFLYLYNKEFNKAKLFWEKYRSYEEDTDLAMEVSHLILEIEDNALYERGYEAILGGRAEEGLPLLLELEERSTNWWNLLFFIGLGYRQLGQYTDAIAYFNKVMEIEENQLDTLSELGLCYGATGNYGKAVECFEMALNIGGENNEILCNLAMVYMEVADYTKAKKCLEHSLAINPQDEITQACNKQLKMLMENSR